MNDFLTTEEAARLLRVSSRRLNVMAKVGRIPAIRVGKRFRFLRRELERLAEAKP